MTFNEWCEENIDRDYLDNDYINMLEKAYEAGQLVPDVEWHKNVPEDQPKNGDYLWLKYLGDPEPVLAINSWRLIKSGLYKCAATHWAYCEAPEPPESEDDLRGGGR